MGDPQNFDKSPPSWMPPSNIFGDWGITAGCDDWEIWRGSGRWGQGEECGRAGGKWIITKIIIH